MQVKLLRVIQEKKVRPVGETCRIPVDVRILSATHRRLDEMVKAGRFREDLYYQRST
ncbi:MAG: sigma 54-interacting transcriptional regulator [Burkholderiales bacterium]